MAEYLDIYDASGRCVGRALRSECHGNPALLHRTAHVVVIRPADGALLLQKRSRSKDIQPGRWDTAVGGHLACGESYEAGAARELREELGVSGAPEFLFDSAIRNEIESEDTRVFGLRHGGPFVFDPAEIDEVRFWTREELEDPAARREFTPNLIRELETLRRMPGWYPPKQGGRQMGKVAILLGSKSDLEVVRAAFDVLDDFGVEFTARILSAHRTPAEAAEFAAGAAGAGYKVILCAAGMAAHLGGVVAAYTTLPVVGIPMVSEPFKAADSLLSIVQMPPGVPVAAVTAGKAGAKNAALFAVEILATADPVLAEKLRDFRARQKEQVLAADAELSRELAARSAR